MTIGTSILLIAIGAILKWAVTATISGFNIQTAGTVLLIVGIVGLILSLIYTFAWSRSHDRVVYDDRHPTRRQPPPGPPEY